VLASTVVYLRREPLPMGHRHYQRTFLNGASYLLVYCLSYPPPFLVGEFSKLLTFLVFAGLLMFVVVNSAEIRRVTVALFEALRFPLFSLVVDLGSIERSPTSIVAPKKPCLSPLFQRPPPIFSFQPC